MIRLGKFAGSCALAVLIGSCGGQPIAAASKPQKAASPSPPLDLDGRPFDLDAHRDTPVITLVFVRSDCPISNRYAPELRRLKEQFEARGVRFWLVYPDADELPPVIRRHLAEYELPFAALRDPGHVLVDKTGVSVTPEVAVLTAGAVVYHGRIDDRYATVGQARNTPTMRDLEATLSAVLAGRPPLVSRTRAFGCSIPARSMKARSLPIALILLVAAASARSQAESPTFNTDIAPILAEHCSSCHHAGGPAPFGLLTYTDARKRAKDMSSAAQKRDMPPWLPLRAYGHFRNERGLSESEIAAIASWASDGAPEGRKRKGPRARETKTDWQLGVPDVVLALPQPFHVPADGPELVRDYVLPLPPSATGSVRAVELRVDNERAVRRVVASLEHARSGDVWTWTPGAPPYDAGRELAVPLDAATNMAVELLGIPTGKRETAHVRIGLYLSSEPPSARAAGLVLRNDRIDIPPGIREHVVMDTLRLPVDVRVLALYPEAHNLCRSIEVFATLPDHTRRWLLRIGRWDFNWGDVYRYEKPVDLPAGSTIVMLDVYDNTAGNPKNPNHPPQRVVSGHPLTDELAAVRIQVMPRNPADFESLQAIESTNASTRQALKTSGESPVPAAGADPLENAARQYAAALSVNPEDNGTRLNLAGVLVRQGQLEEAETLYRDVLHRDPALVEAHVLLGSLQMRLRQEDAAVESWRQAIKIDPGAADAHRALGVVFARRGQLEPAATELRRAVELNPHDVQARVELAQVLRPNSVRAPIPGAHTVGPPSPK